MPLPALPEWIERTYGTVLKYQSYYVPAILGVSALFWSFKERGRIRRRRETTFAQDRRTRILTDPLIDAVSSDPGDLVLVVMDMAFEDEVVSVVATHSGDASLHFSHGEPIVGGSDFGIRNAAQTFIREAATHRAAFARTTGFLFPEAGNVKFYVRTAETVYVMQRPLSRMTNGEDALCSLFQTGDALHSRLQALNLRNPTQAPASNDP